MAYDPKSLYEILRVPRDAKSHDVERAYRRIKAEMQRDTTPPDPRLRVLVEHAHDVLMDPVRREAYDKEWFAPLAQADRVRRSPAKMAAIAVALAAVGAAAWVALRPPDEMETRPRKEIENAIAMAAGRVTRIDVSGADARLGIAFAIAEGTLVTSCEGLSPDAEIRVHFGKRAAPVRVTAVDEATGLCKLTGGTVGSWPLARARAQPASGHPVYLVTAAQDNEPRLVDSRFRKSSNAGTVQVFEAELRPNARDLGAPLLDAQGRLLGAATRIAGNAVFVPIPAAWIAETVQRSPPIRAPEPEPQPAPDAAPAPEAPPLPGGVKISPERRERLEKAFRPPPHVPSDL